MSDKELKLCPFCGGEAHLIREASENFVQCSTHGCALSCLTDCYVDEWQARAYEQEIKELREQIKSEQWVSVSDRLPDDARIVLFRVSSKTYKGIYLEGCNTFEVEHLCEYFKPDEVTHWKPITPPIK